MSSDLLKLQIIQAGKKAVEQLIKVAKEDRLKNAAATKKLAIFDAFDILNKIDTEQENITNNQSNGDKVQSKQGFAERRSK